VFEGLRGRARAAALQAAVIEAKVAVSHLRDGIAATERELAEMTEALKNPASETDADDPALKIRMDRAGYEAAAEAQLAHLKRKLGKDKP